VIFRNSYLLKQSKFLQVAKFLHNEIGLITRQPVPFHSWFIHLRLDLLLQDVLKGDSVGGELGDTLTEFLDGHSLLVEVEAEQGLVVEVAALGDVEGGGGGSVELLGNGVLGVVELLKETGLWFVSDTPSKIIVEGWQRTEMVK
jgi:hypothetical protein